MKDPLDEIDEEQAWQQFGIWSLETWALEDHLDYLKEQCHHPATKNIRKARRRRMRKFRIALQARRLGQ